MEMTLTRALNEIKLLEKKIAQYSGTDVTWIALSKNGVIGDKNTIDELKKVVSSNKKSLNDLINRRNKIKKALLKANNEITLTVAGNTYTIAEAIDRKNFIFTEKTVYKSIKLQVTQTLNDFEYQQKMVDDKVERTIAQALQGDGKKDPTVVSGIEQAVRDNLKFKIEDPEHVIEWIDNIMEEVTEFENEIDFTLSEVNATHKIDVD